MRPLVSLITLGVNDLTVSKKFYEETLGWGPPTDGTAEVAFYQLRGGLVLGLFSKQSLAEDANVPFDGSGFPGFTLAHNCGSREEVDALFAELKAKGVTIMKPPHEVFWGGYSGYFSDPDGYLWEVAHNPFWKLDDQGLVTLP